MVKQRQGWDLTRVNAGLLIVLLVVLLFSVYSLFSLNAVLKPQEVPPLPKVSVMLLVAEGCKECFDITQVESFVRKLGTVNVTEVTTVVQADAQDLIATYALERLPAAIIVGEVENVTIDNFEKREGALVFDVPPAPYVDPVEGRVRGELSVTVVVDKKCKKCSNVSAILDQLDQFGVRLADVQIKDYVDADALKLIKKYDIKKIPTVIFDAEASVYDIFGQVWAQVGSIEDDGSYVLRQVSPPFVEVATDKVRGIVDVQYLVDKSCVECYNVSVQKRIFEGNFGMVFGKESTIDVASVEGKALIEKYDITVVPTSVLSAEAEVYPSVEDVWSQAGSRAEDGSFVFHNVHLLEVPYKNLTSGMVVSPEPAKNTDE